MDERHRARPRPSWLDGPPTEWPDSYKRFWNIMATAAERKLNRERDQRGGDPQ